MNIDRHNYEEFFILYLDNELSAADRQRVEGFAMANPDLKDELDLLLQSKLTPESDIFFDGKASLLKHEEEIAGETASILLYMDNEMDPVQKRSFEEWITQHPDAKKELEGFQQTKLQPEHIAFPHKQSLYRQEERRVVAIRWWRMAAAAVLLLGVSTATFMFNQQRQENKLAQNADSRQDTANSIAEAPGQQKTAAPSSVKLDDIPATDPHISAIPDAVMSTSTEKRSSAERINENAATSSSVASHENGNEAVNTGEAAAAAPETSYVVNKRTDLSEMLGTDIPVDNSDLQADPSLTINKQINPLPTVTQEEDQPLDIMNEPGKKNKLRGFFRKITRTFEKTTNIKATDGEDRLLVGGLAIKF